MTFPVLVVIAERYPLIVLFFPFSALDKIINFRGAVGQAQQAVASRGAASILILIGLGVEIFMPRGILLGIADRPAAFIMAGYCYPDQPSAERQQPHRSGVCDIGHGGFALMSA